MIVNARFKIPDHHIEKYGEKLIRAEGVKNLAVGIAKFAEIGQLKKEIGTIESIFEAEVGVISGENYRKIIHLLKGMRNSLATGFVAEELLQLIEAKLTPIEKL